MRQNFLKEELITDKKITTGLMKILMKGDKVNIKTVGNIIFIVQLNKIQHINQKNLNNFKQRFGRSC